MNNPFRNSLSDPAIQRERLFSQDERLLAAARTVASRVPRALVVGGFVRDALLGITSHDADIEVYGLPPEQLEALLEELFPNRVNLVGRAFGIFKIALSDGFELDVSLPRRESKVGKGHTGFAVQGDPSMTVEEASRRRDFTINAMAADLATGSIIDPFGGVHDLEQRVLRMVDPETFPDDPLRVYRALQFLSRFELTLEEKTFDLMREMVSRGDLAELSKERVTEEMKKLLLKSEHPSLGFWVARDLGIIERDFPELQALIGTEQEKEWHPEGDVWIHTLLVVDQAAQIIRQDERGLEGAEKLHVMLGALCHDLGKPSTTQVIEDRIRSRGHEDAGEEPTRSLLSRFSFGEDAEHAAVAVATEHLKPGMLAMSKERGDMNDEQYTNAVRKVLKRIHPTSWRVLLAAAEADWRGRDIAEIKGAQYEHGRAFVEAVRELERREALRPLLFGRDLLELGVEPGPRMGELLAAVESARDRGEIKTKDEALRFVGRRL